MSSLLTPEEVSKRLKLTKYTIYEMVKRGDLKASKIGGRVRIFEESVESYMSGAKSEPKIEPSTNQSHTENSIVFMGSHDMRIQELVKVFNKEYPSFTLIPAYIGSMEGLLNLHYNRADIAGIHLYDEETDSYNTPYVKRFFPNETMEMIHWQDRKIGWIVKCGNPKNIKSWEDIARPELRFSNRQKGAGTRILLDLHINRLHVNFADINGYENTSSTHLEAAAEVANGNADFALGIESAAASLGLDFVPLTVEKYDFVMRDSFYHSAKGQALVSIINIMRLDYI